MKEIKNHKDVMEFSGKIIRLDPNGSYYLGAGKGPYQQDGICFAHISGAMSPWPTSTLYQTQEGFNMDLLLKPNEAAGSHALTDDAFTLFNVKMRLATAEELNQIERLIREGKAVFEYMDKDRTLRVIENEKRLGSQETEQKFGVCGR